MKKLIITLVLLATPAFAQTPSPKPRPITGNVVQDFKNATGQNNSPISNPNAVSGSTGICDFNLLAALKADKSD